MKKYLFSVIMSGMMVNISAFEVKSNDWNFVGVTKSDTLSNYGVKSDDRVWAYKDNKWICSANIGCADVIDKLESGDAFWLRSKEDYNLSISSGSVEKELINGWSMYSPVKNDINVSETFDPNFDVVSVWGYDHGWSLWLNEGNYTSESIKQLSTLRVGDGSWVHKATGMMFGTVKSYIDQGAFRDVEHSSIESVEDIWNLTVKIDPALLATSKKIGVKLVKNVSGSYGDIIFNNVKITDGTLNTPTSIKVYGNKSGVGGQSTTLSDSTILANSLKYENSYLKINLGAIMEFQTTVDSSTFKGVSSYDVTIMVDDNTSSNVLVSSSDLEADTILAENSFYTFKKGSSVVSGKLIIK